MARGSRGDDDQACHCQAGATRQGVFFARVFLYPALAATPGALGWPCYRRMQKQAHPANFRHGEERLGFFSRSGGKNGPEEGVLGV